MKKILEGIKSFQDTVFGEHEPLFQKLADGQSPDALFVTCSDSRIDPNLVTQTKPGDLFVLRNAGNLVPAFGASNGGEASAVEYAVSALGVSDIIVCGHSQCGAMGGLLNPDSLASLPTVAAWLQHAASTRQVVEQMTDEQTKGDKLMAAIQANVLAQIDNLKTHPCVAAALANDKLRLHAWVYAFESGGVTSYDPAKKEFTALPTTI